MKTGGKLLIGAAIVVGVAAVVMFATGRTSLEASLISGVLAAVIGWLAADRRQSDQQAAEDARHRAELAQQKELHELDASRSLLKETWDTVDVALQRRTEAVWEWRQLPGAASEPELSRFADADRSFGQSLEATDHGLFLVTTLLDRNHGVVRALSDVHAELVAIYEILAPTLPRTPLHVAEIERRKQALVDALDRFRAESEALTGFQLPALDTGRSAPPALDPGRS